MPGINVSALSGGDLRRLLKVAHARHDGLLADTLEWEIAARKVSVVRSAGPFATLPDEPPDYEPDAFALDAAPPGPLAPRDSRPAPARPRRGALLVTLGAISGGLLSAALFWTLARTDLSPVAAPATEPQPVRAMAATVATPMAERLVEELTPAPLPPGPEPVASPKAPPAATVEAPRPAAKAPAKVARKTPPAKRSAPVKAASKPKPRQLAVAKAEHAPRPPNLAEWLAKSEASEPIR